ncbi:MAG: Ku protein [Nannocystaceae bacterium]
MIFTPEELDAVEEQATGGIDIVEFVPIAAVDPLFYDKAYYLGPEEGAARAYHLLAEALRRTGLVALAKYAARGKQYLVLLRPVKLGLIMQQLHLSCRGARDGRRHRDLADYAMGRPRSSAGRAGRAQELPAGAVHRRGPHAHRGADPAQGRGPGHHRRPGREPQGPVIDPWRRSSRAWASEAAAADAAADGKSAGQG